MSKKWKFGKPREFFKETMTFCKDCGRSTEHKIHFGGDRSLRSQCEECGREVASMKRVAFITGEQLADCAGCGTATVQFTYEDHEQKTTRICSSCGREVPLRRLRPS